KNGPSGSSRLASEGRAVHAAFLVQLAVEVEALEHELDGRGDRRGIAGRPELRDGALHPGALEGLLDVLLARQAGGHVHRSAALARSVGSCVRTRDRKRSFSGGMLRPRLLSPSGLAAATTNRSSGRRILYPRIWTSRSSITFTRPTWRRSARSGGSFSAEIPR